jgi:hypothetical protein
MKTAAAISAVRILERGCMPIMNLLIGYARILA